jgi:hypothetical protein
MSSRVLGSLRGTRYSRKGSQYLASALFQLLLPPEYSGLAIVPRDVRPAIPISYSRTGVPKYKRSDLIRHFPDCLYVGCKQLKPLQRDLSHPTRVPEAVLGGVGCAIIRLLHSKLTLT